MGHKDIQDGPKVGIGKVALAGYKPSDEVNLEHRGKPQERVDVKCPHARQADPGNHTRECRPVHSAKRKIGKDLGEFVQPRRSVAVKTTDTPPERYSPV